MRFRAVLTAVVLAVAMATSAQAAKLVVMATNLANGVGDGSKTYTIGVQVGIGDLVGAGANPPLGAFGITWTGDNVLNPEQSINNGEADLQTIQGGIDAVGKAAKATAPFPANADETQGSWWYNGASGIYTGIISGTAKLGYKTGTIVTNPAVGPTGYLFVNQGGPMIGGGVDGDTMSFNGLFGPNGANALDAAPIAARFVSGVLTVALAQITTTGDVPIAFLGSAVSFLSVGQKAFNVLGGAANVDPNAHLDFAQNAIIGVPEPGTFVLLGMGAVGLLLAWKRRK